MNKPIGAIEEFIAKTEKLEGRSLLYRGLADATWEVSASAYRRIKTSSEVALPPPRIFQNYMEQLLDSAGLRGFRNRQGRSHSDLELLAELQHNGAATCLIDFTTNALVALWFACREELDKDGKVAAMATDNTESFSTVSYQDLEKPIKEFLYKDEKLWKWEPSHLSNRIVAQQSIFVFGEGIIEERHYEKIRIDKNNKGKIREELEKRFGITERHLFSDFTGFALSNAHNRPYSYTTEDYYYLGVELHQQGDFQKAKNYYDQAIDLDPQFAVAHNGRGSAKRALGDHQGAITDYDQAIKLDPQLVVAYYNRGDSKRALGDHQGAITD